MLNKRLREALADIDTDEICKALDEADCVAHDVLDVIAAVPKLIAEVERLQAKVDELRDIAIEQGRNTLHAEAEVERLQAEADERAVHNATAKTWALQVVFELQDEVKQLKARHDIAKGFHDVAVAERNFERHLVEMLRERLRDAHREIEEMKAIIDGLIGPTGPYEGDK